MGRRQSGVSKAKARAKARVKGYHAHLNAGQGGAKNGGQSKDWQDGEGEGHRHGQEKDHCYNTVGDQENVRHGRQERRFEDYGCSQEASHEKTCCEETGCEKAGDAQGHH